MREVPAAQPSRERRTGGLAKAVSCSSESERKQQKKSKAAGQVSSRTPILTRQNPHPPSRHRAPINHIRPFHDRLIVRCISCHPSINSARVPVSVEVPTDTHPRERPSKFTPNTCTSYIQPYILKKQSAALPSVTLSAPGLPPLSSFTAKL